MTEIVKISLENEMDLVLAHRHTIKLSELCGLSRSAQTIFATAVSEISRCAITYGSKAYLVLSINSQNLKRKYIAASIFNDNNLVAIAPDGLAYAKKLMDELETDVKGGVYELRISYLIPYAGLINDTKIKIFKDHFKNAPPVSPYEEIRKKNIQLIDLAEKLRKSEHHYQLLTDNMPLMMFALNHKQELDYYNKGLRDYLTIKEGDAQLHWQSILHPEDLTAHSKGWDKAVGLRESFSTQARIKEQGTGKYIWHLISVVPVKNAKDLSVKWIGFFANIHAQKLIEETLKDNKELKEAQHQLRNYQQQLEYKIAELNASNRDLEQFAYIASHDLQEPLRKIKTYALIIEQDVPMDEKNTGYFGKVLKAVNRMSNLITDVLEYSRVNRSTLKRSDVNLNLALEEIKQDLDLLIKEKEAVVKVPHLPIVNGIPSQLTQLFYNLISNSLKFCITKPVIKITYSKVTGKERESLALTGERMYGKIVLTDNGIGFDQQFADKIFDIFQRLNSQQEYPGTGIGLALCKKIVENHNGKIFASSKLGEGAQFTIVLPVKED